MPPLLCADRSRRSLSQSLFCARTFMLNSFANRTTSALYRVFLERLFLRTIPVLHLVSLLLLFSSPLRQIFQPLFFVFVVTFGLYSGLTVSFCHTWVAFCLFHRSSTCCTILHHCGIRFSTGIDALAWISEHPWRCMRITYSPDLCR